MSKQNSSVVQPMLIFIPDISGFSKFVSNTEISHSQHIIAELLEILIDSNELGLNVSEIEGDAILYYKEGELPEFNSILEQIKSMYFNFHSHLKQYELSRICQCGACTTANDLQLKFVLNYGDVSFNKIKDYIKLFGREVIVAHRLLKNNINEHEYALFGQNLIEAYVDGIDLGSSQWIKELTVGSEEYDIGRLDYKYTSLSGLHENIPPPEIKSFGLKGNKTLVAKTTFEFQAPIDLVFDVLSDFSLRDLWNDKIKASDHLNGAVARNGSTHRCLINDNSRDPFLVAHDFKLSHDRMVFTETDEKVGFSIVNELLALTPETTSLITNTFVRGKYLLPIFFKLFVKRKLIAGAAESNKRINDYCKNLLATGSGPKVKIVL